MKLSLTVKAPLSLRSATARLVPSALFPPERLIKEGHIQVDGQRCKQNSPLQPGQVLTVSLAPEALPPVHILREADGWLAAEKRPGIEVCGEEGLTLERLLRIQGYPVAACHRLDVWTGGIVLFALSEETRQAALSLWDTQLSKEYDAILAGALSDRGDARGWLLKNAEAARVRVSSGRLPGALPIHTEYRVVARQEGLCRAAITLHTGRTHQIRAHMACLGAPVLGDDLYGNRTANKRFRVIHPCLWARFLCFSPELPDDFSGWKGLTLESPPVYPRQIASLWQTEG